MPSPLGGRRRSGWTWGGSLLLILGISTAVHAQSFRLGTWDVTMSAGVDLVYDSNVDEAYPDEQVAGYRKDDFLWIPRLSLSTKPMVLGPGTTLSVVGNLSYEDYFRRNDLDVELYNLTANFQSMMPRVTFGGYAMMQYDVENEMDDTYYPGGRSRDPYSTYEGNLFFNWNFNRLRVETYITYTRERHDNEQYKPDDQDEVDWFAGVYLDLFSWGSLYYSYERDITTFAQNDVEEKEITKEFGLTGTLPLTWIRHPQITYTFGLKSEDKDDAEGATWEPNHVITLADELQLSRSLLFSGTATWENEVADDEVGFTFTFSLEHQISPRVHQSLSFEQEPESTFGSNKDTKLTAYVYQLGIRDLFIPRLNFNGSMEYKEEEPLGVENPRTEYTPLLTIQFMHDRLLSRRLSRTLSYIYTWEGSNFHEEGANERHLITYGLNYQF
ncbi:MAG: hypothetical protein LBN38_07450 [Verrucomicrobiota bacterium]|nr:hypothetical protein [Verrucomicrobiota bacterium]